MSSIQALLSLDSLSNEQLDLLLGYPEISEKVLLKDKTEEEGISSNNNEIHKGAKHPNKSYSCSQCIKSFTSDKDYTRHKERHTAEKSYSSDHPFFKEDLEAIQNNQDFDSFNVKKDSQTIIYDGFSISFPKTVKQENLNHEKLGQTHQEVNNANNIKLGSFKKKYPILPSPKRKRNAQKSIKLISTETVPAVNAASPNIENDVSKENVLQNLEPEQDALIKYEKEKYSKQNLVLVRERQFSCNKCNKQYSAKSDLRRHKASVHEGVRYPCDQCDVAPFMHADHLRRHKASAHEGVRYPCDQCDVASFTQAGYLRQHQASAHEGVRYPCDQCDVTPFSTKNGLRHHKASTHEGVRYPCDQCDVAPFKWSTDVRQHKASAHEGVRYECNTCDYKATQKSNLKKHTKKYHNI